MQKTLSGFSARAAALPLVVFVCGASLLAAKTAVPALLLPRVTVCLLTALSLASLVLARAFTGPASGTAGEAAADIALAALCFGLAAWSCGLANAARAAQVAFAGGAVYAACLLAFEGAERRARGMTHPLAALTSFAFLAWLASQIFAGWVIA